jgi:hypothetical protein
LTCRILFLKLENKNRLGPAARGERRMKENFDILFSPFTVKNLVLKNRIVYPPMGTSYATRFGSVTQRLISYHRERAAGGVGINWVEFTVVEPRGKLNPHMMGIYDDSHIPGLKRREFRKESRSLAEVRRVWNSPESLPRGAIE